MDYTRFFGRNSAPQTQPGLSSPYNNRFSWLKPAPDAQPQSQFQNFFTDQSANDFLLQFLNQFRQPAQSAQPRNRWSWLGAAPQNDVRQNFPIHSLLFSNNWLGR